VSTTTIRIADDLKGPRGRRPPALRQDRTWLIVDAICRRRPRQSELESDFHQGDGKRTGQGLPPSKACRWGEVRYYFLLECAVRPKAPKAKKEGTDLGKSRPRSGSSRRFRAVSGAPAGQHDSRTRPSASRRSRPLRSSRPGPHLGRPTPTAFRELVIGTGSRGHIALYGTTQERDAVFVWGVRSQNIQGAGAVSREPSPAPFVLPRITRPSRKLESPHEQD